MYNNLFIFNHINSIGGVETYLYTMAKKYGNDHDIAVVYKEGDPAQIARLEKLVRVIKYDGQRFQCKKAFFNYSHDLIDQVDAEEYYCTLHADYKAIHMEKNVPVHPKFTTYLGVSQHVCNVFEEITGIKPELAYNPIDIPKPKKILHLISACRLTYEKGKSRMIKFGQMLNAAEIPYIWTIYTDNTKEIDNPNIIYRKPELNIIDYIADADYLVQLSDTEGYSYSLIESLSVGTPVIVTDIPVLPEIGVIHGKNGFVIPMDMSNVPIDDIYTGLPPFKYTPKKDRFNDILVPGKGTYQEELKTLIELECLMDYHDGVLKRIVRKGERIAVNKIQAAKRIEAGVCKYKGE